MLTHHTIKVNNTLIHYWERNSHADHTIVLIHGFRGNHKALTEFSGYFENSRTITLDLPGYGQSDNLPSKHTIKNYADFLHQFFAELKLKNFDVIGHSYGGSIAIVYASKYPQLISHLVVISPAIPIDLISQTLAKIQLGIMRRLPLKLQKKWLSSPIIEFISTMSQFKTVSRKRKLEMLSRGLKNAKIQRPKVIIECLDSFLSTSFYTYARQITTPTYIMAGETDLIAPLKTQVLLAEEINLSRIEFMPEIGHLAPLERPKTIGRLIDNFLTHDNQKPTHLHRASQNTFTIHPRQHKVLGLSNN